MQPPGGLVQQGGGSMNHGMQDHVGSNYAYLNPYNARGLGIDQAQAWQYQQNHQAHTAGGWAGPMMSFPPAASPTGSVQNQAFPQQQQQQHLGMNMANQQGGHGAQGGRNDGGNQRSQGGGMGGSAYSNHTFSNRQGPGNSGTNGGVHGGGW